jgi:hypothetical protein
MRPTVSFLCTTYGRMGLQPHLMNEMVYWFCQQTVRSRCELVIVNDAPGRTLECGVSGVRVHNFPERFPNWGAKLNAGLKLCEGSIVLPSDDDDVSLPHRAEQAINRLRRADYFLPGLWWYAEGDGCPQVHLSNKGAGWNCAAFRNAAFPGYPNCYANCDQCGAKLMRDGGARAAKPLAKPEEVSYVYRWGVSCQHFSGNANLKGAFDAMNPGPAGNFLVEPKKRHDWPSLVAEEFSRAVPA